MDNDHALGALKASRVFDGGDMDCGSGLILLIRQNILQVKEGEILELRSREPTVRTELPPWCRMVGHEYLGALDGEAYQKHFIRRGLEGAETPEKLREDQQKARDYWWRIRTRASAPLQSTIYCRNFSFHAGQPASFETKDHHPSALEYLLGSLAADLASGFASLASRQGIDVDDVEISMKGQLHNVLAHLGIEDGDPSLKTIDLTCFVSSFGSPTDVRAVWEMALERSPVYQTLRKCSEITARLALV